MSTADKIEESVREAINDIVITCPDCGYYAYDDEQYTCTTCWCVGGEGTISATELFEVKLIRKS